MAVFITATTDPFEDVRAQPAPSLENIRRPLRGLQIKEDRYAVLRVKDATGADLPIFDSSSPDADGDNIGRSNTYANFILQQLQDQRTEKQQIIQTFGEDYIFFFGEQPRFINASGILLNTRDFNWKNEFLENYERYLRGTRLVELNARLYLYFDDIVIEGYLINSSITHSADMPYHVQFQFQMFVCQYATLSQVGSVIFHTEEETFQGTIAELSGGGLAPDTDAGQAALAQNAAVTGSSGGLQGVLASAARFFQNPTVATSSVLEQITNELFRTPIIVPGGLVNRSPIIQDQASYSPAPTGRPISEINDEYVVRAPASSPQNDQAYIERVTSELKLQTPEELEKAARQDLQARGVDTTRRDTTYMLLGRGAFAAASYVAPFGVRQALGTVGG
jgi:hypothetical protein